MQCPFIEETFRTPVSAILKRLSFLNRPHCSVTNITTNFPSGTSQTYGLFCNLCHLHCLAACAADGPHFRLHLQNTPHLDVLHYQTESAASNLQFGPTKGRILSAAVDTASRAMSDSWATRRLGQHSGYCLPYSPTLLVGACHHTWMHWE
jgi:hypothetical protein